MKEFFRNLLHQTSLRHEMAEIKAEFTRVEAQHATVVAQLKSESQAAVGQLTSRLEAAEAQAKKELTAVRSELAAESQHVSRELQFLHDTKRDGIGNIIGSRPRRSN